MKKIILFPFMFIIIGCTQESEQDVIEVAPVEYQLIAHTGIDSLPTSEVTMTIEGDRFSGKGPVNRYFGQINEGKISSPIGSTMMAGPEGLMNYEQQFFAALESANLQDVGSDTMRITKNSEAILVFMKSDH